jgi:hypothetical protein
MSYVVHRKHPYLSELGLFETEQQAERYHAVAFWSGLSFMEIFRMVLFAVYGPEALSEKFVEPLRVFEDEVRQLERDQATMRSMQGKSATWRAFPGSPTKLQILLHIHRRALASITKALEQERDPVKRLELEAVLGLAADKWERTQQMVAEEIERRIGEDDDACL